MTRRRTAGAAADGAVDEGFLPTLLGYRLRRAQQLVFAHFAEALAAEGVTPGQVGLLVLIGRNPGISQSALARAVGVERSTLGQGLEPLLERALVERAPAPGDRRSKSLRLSAAGERFVEALEPKLRAHEAEVAGHLGAAERERLLELLARLVEGRRPGRGGGGGA